MAAQKYEYLVVRHKKDNVVIRESGVSEWFRTLPFCFQYQEVKLLIWTRRTKWLAVCVQVVDVKPMCSFGVSVCLFCFFVIRASEEEHFWVSTVTRQTCCFFVNKKTGLFSSPNSSFGSFVSGSQANHFVLTSFPSFGPSFYSCILPSFAVSYITAFLPSVFCLLDFFKYTCPSVPTIT